MKIYSVEKVVKTYAEIETNIGEFRVYESGYVERYCTERERYVEYDKYSNHWEDISDAGLNILGSVGL